MRLSELEPEFVGLWNERSGFSKVERIEDADGLWFLCPKCFAANGGPIGTHRILCLRPRVPHPSFSEPGRWEFDGSGFEDLTLVAGSSSVQVGGGCEAHFWVRAGAIVMA